MKEETLEELEAFGDPSELLGTALIGLADSNGGAFEAGGPEWSALP